MRFTFTALALLITSLLIAQAPALIPYQAIARNAAGEPLASSTLNARFTIHDVTANGTSVWQELQTVSTSALGLFTAQLGSSVPLSSVNWANGAKFMQVEIDLGNGFVDIGTQQLLSVPYALHAGNGFDRVTVSGDTLFLANGEFMIIPGISSSNIGNGENSIAHSCGAPNIHNDNLTYGSMTDQQGNVYKTIIIGAQEWMAENLKTSIYRNGAFIETNLYDTWQLSSYGAWTYYKDDPRYVCPYGKLYNWYACADFRQLCPAGWHVPSDLEWTILSINLGGEAVAGTVMKTAGTIEGGSGLWYAPNSVSDESPGFAGVPGGLRYNDGLYYSIGQFGGWWSSTSIDSDIARGRGLYYFSDYLNNANYDKHYGLSVRCLRD